jgi:hypothetical protein
MGDNRRCGVAGADVEGVTERRSDVRQVVLHSRIARRCGLKRPHPVHPFTGYTESLAARRQHGHVRTQLYNGLIRVIDEHDNDKAR